MIDTKLTNRLIEIIKTRVDDARHHTMGEYIITCYLKNDASAWINFLLDITTPELKAITIKRMTGAITIKRMTGYSYCDEFEIPLNVIDKNRLTEELVATYNNRVKLYNKSQLVKLYEILGIK